MNNIKITKHYIKRASERIYHKGTKKNNKNQNQIMIQKISNSNFFAESYDLKLDSVYKYSSLESNNQCVKTILTKDKVYITNYKVDFVNEQLKNNIKFCNELFPSSFNYFELMENTFIVYEKKEKKVLRYEYDLTDGIIKKMYYCDSNIYAEADLEYKFPKKSIIDIINYRNDECFFAYSLDGISKYLYTGLTLLNKCIKCYVKNDKIIALRIIDFTKEKKLYNILYNDTYLPKKINKLIKQKDFYYVIIRLTEDRVRLEKYDRVTYNTVDVTYYSVEEVERKFNITLTENRISNTIFFKRKYVRDNLIDNNNY